MVILSTTMTSSLISKNDAFQAIVWAGLPVIRLLPGTKRPVETDWVVNAAPDPLATPEAYPGNYGVAIPKNVVVVDADPRSYDEGDNPLDRLLADLGFQDTPQTFIVKTGGGGYHIYFKKPENINLRVYNVERYGKGIQIKTYGTQVVGPGSIHPDTGMTYDVLHGDPSEMLDAPEGLFRLFEKSDFSGESLAEYTSAQEVRDKYTSYLSFAEPAVQSAGGDAHTLAVALKGRDYGLSPSDTYELMFNHWNDKCAPPWDAYDLRQKVRNAYKYAKGALGSELAVTQFDAYEEVLTPGQKAALQWNEDREEAERRAKIHWYMSHTRGVEMFRPNPVNVVNMLRHGDFGTYVNPLHKLVAYDDFAKQIVFVRRAPWHKNNALGYWTDTDTIEMVYYLSDTRGWTPPKDLVLDGVLHYAREFSFNPVVDTLKSTEWDGVPRISSLFSKYAGALNNEYNAIVSRCFMIGAVARVVNPGCQNDHTVILEGRQGTGKSSFLRVLFGKHHTDIHLNPHDKDTVVRLMGSWGVELSEMAHNRKTDVDAVKSFLTLTHDNIRLPYGRMRENIPRSCVFIGTLNPQNGVGYLRDTTGNRRFWPVKTNVIDLASLKKDRMQLWAEAYQAYKCGEAYHFTQQRHIDLAKGEQAARVEEEVWIDIVADWVDKQVKLGNPVESFTLADISYSALGIHPKDLDRYKMARLAEAMHEIGYSRTRLRDGSARISGFQLRQKGYEYDI